MKSCPSFDALSAAFSRSHPTAIVEHARSCIDCGRIWTELTRMRAAAQTLPYRTPSGPQVETQIRTLSARAAAEPPLGGARTATVPVAIAVATAAAVVAIVTGHRSPPPAPAVAVVTATATTADSGARVDREGNHTRLDPAAVDLDVEPSAGEVGVSRVKTSIEVSDGAPSLVWTKSERTRVGVRVDPPRILDVGERWSPPAPPPAEPDASEDLFLACWRTLESGDGGAAACFADLLARAPPPPLLEEASYWHAIALLRAGRTSEAEDALRRFYERAGSSSRRTEVALYLGTQLLARGALVEAQAYLRVAATSSASSVRSRALGALEEAERGDLP